MKLIKVVSGQFVTLMVCLIAFLNFVGCVGDKNKVSKSPGPHSNVKQDTTGLSKKQLVELFLTNRTNLLELATLIIYAERHKPPFDTYYNVAQGTLDYFDAAIEKDGNLMDMSSKDEFIYAGIVYGHFSIAVRMGLITDNGRKYELDSTFVGEIKDKIINVPSVCRGGDSLVRTIILDSIHARE